MRRSPSEVGGVAARRDDVPLCGEGWGQEQELLEDIRTGVRQRLCRGTLVRDWLGAT